MAEPPPPPPRGGYTQELTEEFSQAQAEVQAAIAPRRPRFTVLVDTAPTKTQGVVLTVTEAFADAFGAVAQEHGVTDWRLVPHGHGAALVYQAVRSRITTDASLEGAVILLRSGTTEGALLYDLLVEHALDVYGG